MKSATVCYDSYHGHCADIADRIVRQLGTLGYRANVHSVRSDETIHIASMDAVVVVAPIHTGRHSKPLRRFIHQYRMALDMVPTLFLSVSLSASGTPAQQDDAQRVMENFLDQTLWVPTRTEIAAGDLAYRRYTWPTRWLMRWMAWRAGGATNVGQNHVYTDWPVLHQQISDFVDSIEPARQSFANPTAPSASRVAS